MILLCICQNIGAECGIKLNEEGILERAAKQQLQETDNLVDIFMTSSIASDRVNKRIKEAITLLDKAIELYPDDVGFWMYRASLHLSVKNYDGAINDATHVLNSTDDPDTLIDARKIKDEAELEKGKSSSSGGCFIATAVYSSYDAPEVLVLRRFRDGKLQSSIWGRAFVRFYYTVSPPIAKILRHSDYASNVIKRFLLDPLVLFLEMNSIEKDID